MRLLKTGAILLLTVLPACGGKSGGPAPAGPAPAAVTHPDVLGLYDLEVTSARSTQPAKQTLRIVAGEKPGTFAATLSTTRGGSIQYPSGRWQGQDLILSGSDDRGNTQQLKLRFQGDKFTGALSFQTSNNRMSRMVEGRRQ